MSGSSLRCSRIGTSTFSRTVSDENSAPSWNITPQRARDPAALGLGPVQHVDAQHRIVPAAGRLQPRDGAQQHRLAGARAADDAQDLAAIDVEVEPVVHDVVCRTGCAARAPR
jgi:hypothetical protein